MPRHRKPTNVLELSGAFRKDPNRARPNEPISGTPFPSSPPRRLKRREQQAWKEIIRACAAGVLRGRDALWVENAARLQAEWWDIGRDMAPAKITQLRYYLGALGLSPSDSAKLSVERGKTNPFDKF